MILCRLFLAGSIATLFILGCSTPPVDMPNDNGATMNDNTAINDNTTVVNDNTTVNDNVPVTGVEVTVTFDGDGGATANGTTTFTFLGARFTGGTVRTLGSPSLYASGSFAYEVASGATVFVDFTNPTPTVELFFATRGSGTTTLTALDAAGQTVGMATAPPSTAPSTDKSVTVTLSAPATRVQITHTGDGEGWIDNFSFIPVQ